MGKSYVVNLVHLVFSTKGREQFLERGVRPDLEKFITESLTRLGCRVIAIKAVDDHIHVLFAMCKAYGISRIVGDIKQASTRMLKARHPSMWDFRWQTGYGWFSVSDAHSDAVKRYVLNQEEHHNSLSYKDELRTLFEDYGVDIDERYAWG